MRMGRRRKAWLMNGTGRWPGRPGFWVRWNERDRSGRRRRNPCRSFPTKAMAKKFRDDRNAMEHLRLTDNIVPISIEDAGAEFLESCTRISDETAADYRRCIELLYGRLTETPVCDVTGDDIDALIEFITKGRSEARVAGYCANLSRFFNWCVKRGYASENPVLAATNRPARRHKRVRPQISFEDLERVIANIDTEDRKLAVWIAMTVGLDRGTIERLTREQIDFEAGCFRFIRAKTKKENAVPIHALLLDGLRRRCDGIARTERVLSGLSRQDAASDWWKIATKAAGIEGFLFRDLRAISTTRLVRGGATQRDAQELLGHKSIETTMNHYMIPDPGARRVLDQLPLPGIRPVEAQMAG